MRRDLLEQILAPVLAPRITLRDLADALRKVAPDPVEAERRVGALYGQVFKRKEVVYDARGGLWTGREVAPDAS